MSMLHVRMNLLLSVSELSEQQRFVLVWLKESDSVPVQVLHCKSSTVRRPQVLPTRRLGAELRRAVWL